MPGDKKKSQEDVANNLSFWSIRAVFTPRLKLFLFQFITQTLILLIVYQLSHANVVSQCQLL